ncbi:MAG: hypothetical protein ACHQVK_05380, partial [Candidatus Paceibacterales bacterium]
KLLADSRHCRTLRLWPTSYTFAVENPTEKITATLVRSTKKCDSEAGCARGGSQQQLKYRLWVLSSFMHLIMLIAKVFKT